MSTLLEIQKQIADLQAQEAEIKSVEFNEKLAMVKETMAAYGITVAHLQSKPAGAPKTPGTKSLNPAPAKYKGPNGEAWTGRGLAPKWLTALIAEGHTKEDFLIAK